jgi:hypothetical protein
VFLFIHFVEVLGFPGGKKIAKLFATQATCFAVSTTDEVYVWGLNNYNQAGLNKTEVGEKINAPILVPTLSGRVRSSVYPFLTCLIHGLFSHPSFRSRLCFFVAGQTFNRA